MHPADALPFDDLEVGREWVSAPRPVRAEDLRAFTDLTGDTSPVHLGPEGEAAGPDVARGLFGPAVATGLAVGCPPVRTIAFVAIRDWQFAGPIAAGDAVRIRNRVQAVTPRGVGRRGEVVWRVEILQQRDEVVQSGQIISLVEGRLGGLRPRRPVAPGSPGR
jgi:3-hydroxybutyryl-CoA dehydratase